MTGDSWLKEIRDRGIRQIAEAFGFEVSRRNPPDIKPCPACGAERRSETNKKEKRGPVGITRNNMGWRCHRGICGAGGDPVSLAAFRVLGRVPARGNREGWAEIRRACADRGLCDRALQDNRPALPLKKLPKPNPQQTLTAPKRPPPKEVQELWASCLPVTEDAQVSEWLKSRSLDPAIIAARDLARALPISADVPNWARFLGAAWNKAPQNFRVILPMFDAAGCLSSLHARAVTPKAQNGSDKTAAPAGAELRGLVLADDFGRFFLSGNAIYDGRTGAEIVRANGLWIAEGDPDFLTWSTYWPEDGEKAPTVLGVVSGSWREDSLDLATKVPDGSTVTIATHDDPKGDKYAEHIISSLAHRMRAGQVKVNRWKPRKAQ